MSFDNFYNDPRVSCDSDRYMGYHKKLNKVLVWLDKGMLEDEEKFEDLKDLIAKDEEGQFLRRKKDWVDEVAFVFPCEMQVCSVCDGKGTHVNPSVDCNGLSREDFENDPDFAESYFRGDYDQTCNNCGGNNVEPVIAHGMLEKMDPRYQEILKILDEVQKADREADAWDAAERRMGC